MKPKHFQTVALSCALSALAFSTFSGSSFASGIGTSNASNSVFDDGWQTGDDGDVTGNGFNGWFLSTSTSGDGSAGFFIGDSTNLNGGNTGGNINSAGESWGLFASRGSGGAGNSGAADAFGFFNGSLALGQTFSMDLALNFRNGNKGIDLRNEGTDATIFNFNIGGDDYVVSNATTGNGSIGNAFSTNTVFHLEFTQTSVGGGTWLIQRSGGVTDSDAGTYTGVPSSFKLYVSGTDGGSANDLFANNLAIVPEPAAATMLCAAIALAYFRRRRD